MTYERRPATRNPRLLSIVARLDLTPPESRAYQYLLSTGGAAPSAVARETGQSRGGIYKVLRSLVEKGFAKEEPVQPIRYLPVPLEVCLPLAAEALERRAEILKEAAAELPPAAAPPIAEVRVLTPGDFGVLSGRRAVHAEARRLIQEARQFVFLEGDGRFANRLAASQEILPEMLAAADRGARVDVFLPHDALLLPSVHVLRELLGPLRLHLQAPPADCSIMTVVTESATLWAVPQPADDSVTRGQDIAIRIQGSAFVSRERRRLEAALEDPSLARGPEAERGRPVAIPDLHLRALEGARGEVLGMGPKGATPLVAPHASRILETYRAAKARGVRFRALTEAGPEDQSLRDTFDGIWEVRVAASIPLWLTIIDRADLFQVFPAGPGDSAVGLRHSRDGAEIQHYLALFEALWSSGAALGVAPTPVPSPHGLS